MNSTPAASSTARISANARRVSRMACAAERVGAANICVIELFAVISRVMSPPPKASNFPKQKLRKRPLHEGRGGAQRERCERRAVVGLAVSRNPRYEIVHQHV